MSMATEEKKWQWENDARTLAEAEEIKGSPSRLKGAKTAAKSMAKSQETTAKALKKIASGNKSVRKPARAKAKKK